MDIRVGALTFSADAQGDRSAPLVLLLHGFPQTRHSWRHQLQPLADAGYFAVAPDQRGYSEGARPQEQVQYATERLLGDALGMASALGHARFHLVGHDWGGQIAWLLASRSPERIRSLTVLSRPHPAAFAAAFHSDPDQAKRSKHHRAFLDPATADLLLEDDGRRLRRSLREQGVPQADVSAYMSVLGQKPALEAALNWYRAAGTLKLPEVKPVAVPTLYIWGTRDASVGRVAAERTAEFVSGPFRFEELVDVGHFVTDERGDAVTDLLLEFLVGLDDA